MPENAEHDAPEAVDSRRLDRHILSMYRDVANEADHPLHFPTGRPLAEGLGAACIAGASQADLCVRHLAAAGLALQLIEDNPGYRFTSERARRASDKYGAHSVSLLAPKPVRESRHASSPDLGGGADAAQAALEEGLINTTTTEEVSK